MSMARALVLHAWNGAMCQFGGSFFRTA